MRRYRGVVSCVAVILAVAACSRSDTTQHFETRGLLPPVGTCALDPRNFGDAEKISDINGGGGCQVRNAYKLHSVSGVRLSQAAVVNCGVAGQFNDWVSNTVQNAAEESFGERVVAINVAAAYACRPRNNQSGAKMSEHGFGNAIDIAGFTLESGRTISVLHDWSGRSDARQFLRTVRGEACGQFHTVLGPGSDRHHKDHFHLDLQNRRSGSTYCR